jgi:hypothetical protein
MLMAHKDWRAEGREELSPSCCADGRTRWKRGSPFSGYRIRVRNHIAVVIIVYEEGQTHRNVDMPIAQKDLRDEKNCRQVVALPVALDEDRNKGRRFEIRGKCFQGPLCCCDYNCVGRGRKTG